MKTWIIVGILLLVLSGGGAVVYTGTRGLRNNNPGNLRDDGSAWRGKTGVDEKGFVIFSESVYGIRALMRVLKNYRTRYNLQTIRQIIYRYAPPTENDTESYILSVAKSTGTDSSGGIPIEIMGVDGRENLIALSKAIVKHENGFNPYPDKYFVKAWELELS